MLARELKLNKMSERPLTELRGEPHAPSGGEHVKHDDSPGILPHEDLDNLLDIH